LLRKENYSLDVFSIVGNSDEWNFCCNVVEDLNMVEKSVPSLFQSLDYIMKDAFIKEVWVHCRTVLLHWFESLSSLSAQKRNHAA
jgi:hypothetical protein